MVGILVAIHIYGRKIIKTLNLHEKCKGGDTNVRTCKRKGSWWVFNDTAYNIVLNNYLSTCVVMTGERKEGEYHAFNRNCQKKSFRVCLNYHLFCIVFHGALPRT